MNKEVSGQVFPKPYGAMDGGGRAYRGEASVYEAKLHAWPNDRNLRLRAGPRRGIYSVFWKDLAAY